MLRNLCRALVSPLRVRTMSTSSPPALVDIGANLTDDMFSGLYRGKQVHEGDLSSVLERARAADVSRMVLTGDDLSNSRRAIEVAREHGLSCTVGVHPCQVNVFEREGAEAYMQSLAELIEANIGGKHGSGPVVAVGECGLDYDRLQHATKETQLKHFPPQLDLALRYDLPLFLHARTSEAHSDLVRIMRERSRTPRDQSTPSQEDVPVFRGVVHSFDGSIEEARAILDLGLDLGVNGCSLKTEANLEVVKQLPLDRLHLESDCPWCSIGTTSAAHALIKASPDADRLLPVYSPATVKKERWEATKAVKGRNEPTGTGLVAMVVAALHGRSVDEVARITSANSVRLFNL